MRTVVAIGVCVALAGCGGSPSRVDRSSVPVKLYASGQIQAACLKADRKAASRQLCGCVQAVADRRLSRSDQALAVSFFSDPHRAQEVRQSDKQSHRIFWEKYKGFSAAAKRSCG